MRSLIFRRSIARARAPAALVALFASGAACLFACTSSPSEPTTYPGDVEEDVALEDSGNVDATSVRDSSNDATGTSDASVDSNARDATTDHDTQEDAEVPFDDSGASVDASDVDGAPPDASDAGGGDASAPEPCLAEGAFEQSDCGACGTRTRQCAVDADGVVLSWSGWSECVNQVMDGCVPGEARQETCGRCGMREALCDSECHWAYAVCSGEPINACEPGAVEVAAFACPEAMVRTRTCEVASCAWGPISECRLPP